MKATRLFTLLSTDLTRLGRLPRLHLPSGSPFGPRNGF